MVLWCDVMRVRVGYEIEVEVMRNQCGRVGGMLSGVVEY